MKAELWGMRYRAADYCSGLLGRWAASIFSEKPVAPENGIDIVRIPFRPLERGIVHFQKTVGGQFARRRSK